MHVEKELNLCLKLFAQTSSELADGDTAAIKLQERMARHGIGFDDLLDHVCEHEVEYAYQAAHFFELMARVVVPREPSEACGVENPAAEPCKSAGSPYVQVREHTRTSRKGQTFTVRSHSRRSRHRAEKYDWRKDRSADPGNDYEWIEGHERWHCHAGRGRKIRVRGYWRRKAALGMKKAA